MGRFHAYKIQANEAKKIKARCMCSQT